MLSRRYGKIIGISSVVATTGNPGQSNYVSSKSGLIGLYKSIAHEVAKRKIMSFISWLYYNSMTNKLNEVQKMKLCQNSYAIGDPKDIANLVYFLSSDDSSYITGQNFNVNGGMLMF